MTTIIDTREYIKKEKEKIYEKIEDTSSDINRILVIYRFDNDKDNLSYIKGIKSLIGNNIKLITVLVSMTNNLNNDKIELDDIELFLYPDKDMDYIINSFRYFTDRISYEYKEDDKITSLKVLMLKSNKINFDFNKLCRFMRPEEDIEKINSIINPKTKLNDYPCTAVAVYRILTEIMNLDLTDKSIVTLGRSLHVGFPITSICNFLGNANVTNLHSKTDGIKVAQISKNADIVISSIGKPKFITNYYLSNFAIFIDVSVNIDNNGKYCGDLDEESISKSYVKYTKLQNGVGSMTSLELLRRMI